MDFSKEFLQNLKIHMVENRICKLQTDGNIIVPHFALFPTPVDFDEFESINKIIPYYNLLIDSASRDKEFLKYSLREVRSKDIFIDKLLCISEKVNDVNNKNRQTIHLGLFRHDFFQDSKTKTFKLVEYNTIATVITSFSDSAYKIYKNLLLSDEEYISNINGLNLNSNNLIKSNIVKEDWAPALSVGSEIYSKKYNVNKKDTCIVCILDENETNVFDVYNIQEYLLKEGNESFRTTFSDLYFNGKLLDDGSFIYKEKIVSIFYFRSGYSLDSLENIIDKGKNIGWKIRETIELSNAIKVPDIDSLLMTFKIFQEEFMDENLVSSLLNKFEVKDDFIVKRIMKSFSEIFSFYKLKNDKKEEIISELKKNYNDYVIKPLKEGGNNNYNYDEVKQIAEEKNFDLLEKCLVMKRIYPPISENYILKGMKVTKEEVISEIGIFTYFITDSVDNKLVQIENKVSYPLFRTKNHLTSEGGISVGAAYINSGYLVKNYLN